MLYWLFLPNLLIAQLDILYLLSERFLPEVKLKNRQFSDFALSLKASTNEVISCKQQRDLDERYVWQFEIKQRFNLEEKKLKLKHNVKMRRLELELENNVELRRLALKERKIALQE